MTEVGKQSDVKELLWSRLTSDRAALRLSERTDEEPEDFFVRMSNSGQRKEVVKALRSLLIECLAGDRSDKASVVSRFLGHALRLCDSLAAKECKMPLKEILLTEDPDEFAVELPDWPKLQELAARALLGLAADEKDFRFWSDIAQQCSSSLPYALNAALGIDLDRGMELVCEAWFACRHRGVSGIADWQAIFRIAVLRNDQSNVIQALHRACKCYPETPDLFEYIVHRVARNRGLSLMGKYQLEDVFSYDVPQVLTPTVGESGRPEDVFKGAYANLLSPRAFGDSELRRAMAETYEGRSLSQTSIPIFNLPGYQAET